MARWPAAARCKRRLASQLGAAPAARVQRHLQRHTLTVVDQVAEQLGTSRRLALAGAGPRAGARLQAGEVVLQGAGGLGLRMHRQFVRAFREGYRQVVLIGSDLPELSAADLQAAFDALDRTPLVFGPAADGGYWLVGLTRPIGALFAGMPWGGDMVLQCSLDCAAALGLPAGLLACRHDLDRPADLLRWR